MKLIWKIIIGIVILVILGFLLILNWFIIPCSHNPTTPSNKIYPTPTNFDPLKIYPMSIEVKAGEGKPVQIKIYNKEETDKTFSINISDCSKEGIPDVETLSATIPSGEAKEFKVIVNAKEGETNLSTGKRICKLVATTDDTSYEALFYITVN